MNEPVALMHPACKSRILPIDAPYANVGTNDWIPLYTHPHSDKSVKAKTLTDDEIHKIAQEHFHAGLGINPLDFARAILKRGSAK